MSKKPQVIAFLQLFLFFSLITELNSQESSNNEVLIEVEATPINESSGSSLLSFDEVTLKKNADLSLGDFLKTQPGFQVTTNYQGISNVSLRGLGTGNILVFWNGIRLNDPLDPTASFDFSRIQLGALQKIEIIRGPEAAIWGSGATGAVMFITSESQSDVNGYRGEVEGSVGTYETYTGSGKIILKSDKSESLFSGRLKRSQGISAASESLGNVEKDGRADEQGLFYNSYKLGPQWVLKSLLNVSHSKNDADLRGGIAGDEYGAQDSQATVATSMQLQYKERSTWHNLLSISYQNDQRYHENSVEYARYKSQYSSVSNEVFWQMHEKHILRTALEGDFETGKSNETTGFIKADRHALALRSSYEANYFPFIFKTGFRGEKDIGSSRNPAWSLFLGPSYTFVQSGTNISASAGHAFRRASLYQLYSSYGNSSLDAEEMWSYEASLLQDLKWIKSQLHVTYFWNHADESIDFDFPTMKYFNGGEKENYGFEGVFETQWASFLKSRLEYTWTHTSALRVAEHKASGRFDWNLGSKISFTNEVRYVGERQDIDPAVYTRKNKPAYVLFNAQLAFQLFANLETRLKVDNLLDTEYEEIDGFGSPGRYAELSLKYLF